MHNEYRKIFTHIALNKLTGTAFKRSPCDRVYIKRFENGKATSAWQRYFSNAIALFKDNQVYVFREDQHENTDTTKPSE